MSPEDILADFRKKYENTFVFVEMPDRPNEDNLFHLSSIKSGSNGNGVMRLSSDEFGQIQLNFATAHTIKFKFPEVGVFQMGHDAYMAVREPKRQWSRGLCNGNCTISNVANRIANRSVRSAEGLSFTMVAAAFAKISYSYRDAIGMLKGGKYRSVALKDGFSVALSVTPSYEFLLLHWNRPVAGITKDELVVLEAAFSVPIKKVLT